MSEKPRLRRGLALTADDGRLIVQGGERRHVFRGKAARTVLPGLLPLLDGRRSLLGLCRDSGLGVTQLRQILGMLADRRLLEDATPPRYGTAPAHVRDYLSRTLDPTERYSGVGGYLDALAVGGVAVVGAPGIGESVAADLRVSGVAGARFLSEWADPMTDPTADPTAVPAESRCRLVVPTDDGTGPPDLLERWAERGAAIGVPVLRVALDRTHVEVGPVFLAGHTACVSCFRAGRAAIGWGAPEAARPAVADLAVAADLAAGLGGAEALALLSGSSSHSPARGIRRVSLADWTSERFLVAPEAGCPDCGWETPGGESWPLELYEWSVERPPPRAVRPVDTLQDLTEWATLTGERPDIRYMTRPRRALPAASLTTPGTYGATARSDPGRPRAGAPLDEALIADVLARVGGFRADADPETGRPHTRWAPNGGSLASVELYLVADAGFPGLPGTVFRYDDTRHGLIAVRPDAISVQQALRGTDLSAGSPLALFMVAAHSRVAQKYETFAGRLTHLDAGSATAQLCAVLTAHGVPVAFASRWPDGFTDLLDLMPGEQYVTAVAALGNRPQDHA